MNKETSGRVQHASKETANLNNLIMSVCLRKRREFVSSSDNNASAVNHLFKYVISSGLFVQLEAESGIYVRLLTCLGEVLNAQGCFKFLFLVIL